MLLCRTACLGLAQLPVRVWWGRRARTKGWYCLHHWQVVAAFAAAALDTPALERRDGVAVGMDCRAGSLVASGRDGSRFTPGRSRQMTRTESVDRHGSMSREI